MITTLLIPKKGWTSPYRYGGQCGSRGCIELSSTEKGTTFRIYLPVDTENEEPAEDELRDDRPHAVQ